jgi:hypothetical protein
MISQIGLKSAYSQFPSSVRLGRRHRHLWHLWHLWLLWLLWHLWHLWLSNGQFSGNWHNDTLCGETPQNQHGPSLSLKSAFFYLTQETTIVTIVTIVTLVTNGQFSGKWHNDTLCGEASQNQHGPARAPASALVTFVTLVTLVTLVTFKWSVFGKLTQWHTVRGGASKPAWAGRGAGIGELLLLSILESRCSFQQHHQELRRHQSPKTINTRLPVSNPIMWQFEKENVPPKLFFLTLFWEFVMWDTRCDTCDTCDTKAKDKDNQH